MPFSIYVILIVEPDRDVCHDADQKFTGCGFRTVCVHSEQSAHGALSGIAFDMLLIGLSPGQPAIPVFLKSVRRMYPRLRIMVGSSYADQILPSRIADAILSIPFTAAQIRPAIERAQQMPIMRNRFSDW